MTLLREGNDNQLTELLLCEKTTSKHTQQNSKASQRAHSMASAQSNSMEVEENNHPPNGSPTLHKANTIYDLSEILDMEGSGPLRCHRCKKLIVGTSSNADGSATHAALPK